MGSGSTGSGQQSNVPGTLSPVTASLLSLFGNQPITQGGQFGLQNQQTFGESGGVFSPQSFAALPGLLQNMPMTSTEQLVTGGGIQGLGLQGALQSQGLLEQGAGALSQQLQGPEAAIAQARRGFTQETVPDILERAPGFSSSDLQRELTRGGVDLETNIAALRESSQSNAIGQVPGYAQALGSNLLDQAAQVLGFGQLGRDMIREVSPAGDAFRVLTALQSLTSPALTNISSGQQKNKSTGVFA